MGSVLWHGKLFRIWCHFHPFQPHFIPPTHPPIVGLFNFNQVALISVVNMHIAFSYLYKLLFRLPAIFLTSAWTCPPGDLLEVIVTCSSSELWPEGGSWAYPLCFLHVLWVSPFSCSHTSYNLFSYISSSPALPRKQN